MQESNPPEVAHDNGPTVTRLADANSAPTEESMPTDTFSHPVRRSPDIIEIAGPSEPSEPSDTNSTQTNMPTNTGSSSYNPMAIANAIHPLEQSIQNQEAGTCTACRLTETAETVGSCSAVASMNMFESKPLNELEKSMLNAKRIFETTHGTSPTRTRKPEVKTYAWPVLTRVPNGNLSLLDMTSIMGSRCPRFNSCNIKFERSPVITSLKGDSRWTTCTSSEFISNKVNNHPDLFEQEAFKNGEALAGIFIENFKDKPEELVIRLLSWNKPFLVHLNVADAPRYLEVIRSDIRNWFRHKAAESPEYPRDVLHIGISLPFILVSDMWQTAGGRCKLKFQYVLKLSTRLAMQLAEFPGVKIPASLTNGQLAAIPPERKVIIHFVRHAESEQNAWSIRTLGPCRLSDPKLTEKGRSQCFLLREVFPHATRISQIFSSPAYRTLETTQLSFPGILKRDIKVTPCPEIRELGNGIHNSGSDVADLRVQFEALNVRWGEIGNWPPHRSARAHGTFYIPIMKLFLARLYSSGQVIPAVEICTDGKDVVEIVVVSSGGYLGLLEDHFEKTHMDPRSHWMNTQFKSFELAANKWIDSYGVQQNHVLLETEESRAWNKQMEDVWDRKRKEPPA